ncbi:MAG TPA: hypothetical protein VF403_23985, partial [Kofleriaceae bacterium]
MGAALVSCGTVEGDDAEDLGDVQDGKADSALIDVQITVNKVSSTTHQPGSRTYSVKAGNDFDVALVYDGDQFAQ